MKRMILLMFVVLLSAPQLLAQDTASPDCDAYVDRVVSAINSTHHRLEFFVNSRSAFISDLTAFTEVRREWEAIDPPDCALEFHADVIAYFANVGDISAFALALDVDPERASAERLFGESIDRATALQESLVESLSEASGNAITFDRTIAELMDDNARTTISNETDPASALNPIVESIELPQTISVGTAQSGVLTLQYPEDWAARDIEGSL